MLLFQTPFSCVVLRPLITLKLDLKMWKLYRWLRFRERSERNFKVDFQLTIEYNVFKTGERQDHERLRKVVCCLLASLFSLDALNWILSCPVLFVSGARIAKRITCVVSASLLSLFCLWMLSHRLLFLFYTAFLPYSFGNRHCVSLFFTRLNTLAIYIFFTFIPECFHAIKNNP